MTNLIKHPMRKRWNKGCFVKSIIKSYSIMRKKIKSGPTQIVLIVGHCAPRTTRNSCIDIFQKFEDHTQIFLWFFWCVWLVPPPDQLLWTFPFNAGNFPPPPLRLGTRLLFVFGSKLNKPIQDGEDLKILRCGCTYVAIRI